LLDGGHSLLGVFDDDEDKWGSTVRGALVMGPLEMAARYTGHPAVIALGDNRRRQTVATTLDFEWVTVVHPRAWVDPSAQVGPGTVIFAGAVVQACARLGAHVIINTSASVDHDCIVGDFAHIAPGCHLGGQVTIGDGCLMGIGSAAIPGSETGAWSVVGSGSVVTRNIPAGQVAVGVPARVVRPNVG
jgi:sugar O-acyltransferase (sialic acid O-acetyltransferase NeuD family)